jgi:phosphatidylglycerophosphate synthase
VAIRTFWCFFRARYNPALVFPAKVVAVYAVIMGLALSRVRAWHPFPAFGPANTTTTVRAALTAIVCGCIGEPHSPTVAIGAVTAASIATALDGVDGWLARRTRMVSAFGARFDMEVDALLILALSVLTWRHGKAGAWVLASGLLRYVFVAAGWAAPWLNRPLTPTRRARVICVVQILVLLIAMLPALPPSVTSPLAAAGVLVLVYSFAVDSWWLWRHR